jgi:predicted GNAT family N-acyltransferase
MSDLEIIRITTPEEMDAALFIRRRVFIEEQSVSEEEEIDAYDADLGSDSSAVHVLGRLDGEPVATGRLLVDYPAGSNAHAGRVAVLATYRGRGFGRQVMLALQALARERGFPGITLAAQTHAIPFYERLGYLVRGPLFLDAGIEHRWMDIGLTVDAQP